MNQNRIHDRSRTHAQAIWNRTRHKGFHNKMEEVEIRTRSSGRCSPRCSVVYPRLPPSATNQGGSKLHPLLATAYAFDTWVDGLWMGDENKRSVPLLHKLRSSIDNQNVPVRPTHRMIIVRYLWVISSKRGIYRSILKMSDWE